MPPCPSPAGSISPGQGVDIDPSADEGAFTSVPSGVTEVYVQKIRALEEELSLARLDRGDLEVRVNRTSEQLDRLWQDFASERRERQVEINEERMLRVAEMAEIRDRLDKLSKVADLEVEVSYLDPPVLETYIEEQEDENGVPELTAEGQGNKLVFDAKHAEAQLHRVVADAKRAEAMVRREVGRAIADAKAFLEDTGQQQQEFWAARQRIAAFNRTAGSEAPNSHAAECLLLRLDALEMQLRSRLEANEHGFDSVQNCVENLQSLPQQMEETIIALVNQEIDQVRQELLEERLKKRRAREVEDNLVKQAIAEVRVETLGIVGGEAKKLREEFTRSTKEEASRQSIRLHAIEDRLSAVENLENLKLQDEAFTPSQVLDSAKVCSEMEKMKKEFQDVARKVADASAADLADLDQRFNHVEEKLCHLPQAQARGHATDAEANLHRLDDVLQDVEIMKRCLAELAQRFGQESNKTPESPNRFRLRASATAQATQTPISMAPSTHNSWVGPRAALSPTASLVPPDREDLTAQVQRQVSSPPMVNRIERSRSVSMVPPVSLVDTPAIMGGSAVVRVGNAASVPMLRPVDTPPAMGNSALVRVGNAASVPMLRPVDTPPAMGNSAVVKVVNPPPVPTPQRIGTGTVQASQRCVSPPGIPMQRGPQDSPYVRFRAVRLPASSVLTQKRR